MKANESVKKHFKKVKRAVKEQQREEWLTEDRASIASLNGFVKENGLFADDADYEVL